MRSAMGNFKMACEILDQVFAYALANGFTMPVDFTTYSVDAWVVRGHGSGTLVYVPAHVVDVGPPVAVNHVLLPVPQCFTGSMSYTFSTLDIVESQSYAATLQVSVPLFGGSGYTITFLASPELAEAGIASTSVPVTTCSPANEPENPIEPAGLGYTFAGCNSELLIAVQFGPPGTVMAPISQPRIS